ncbi:MAG: GNAT family N-acetyltransferase [Candidatus Fimenecus sp.]
MIEFALLSDKKELSRMWQNIFLEDGEITELFFEKIFEKAVTPVIRQDGKIVSSLFLLPCKIGGYEGKCVYCAMTLPQYRGKGYMKKLLDFSYDYCKENGFDFLILVPAGKSLFNYYEKCGFERFGVRKAYTVGSSDNSFSEFLKTDCELLFDGAIIEYWQHACVHYGGEIIENKDFSGMAFPDDTTVIKNARGSIKYIPERYRKNGVEIQGDIDLGDTESPAMIRTENGNIKSMKCYVGITLE